MNLIDVVLVGIYIIGIPVWKHIDTKYLLFEDEDNKIPFSKYKTQAKARSIVWPVILFAIILVSFAALFDWVIEKLGL